MSTRAAISAVVVLLAAGLAVAYAVSWQLGLLLTGYKALTMAYTFRLKHTPTVDIVVVACGFIVRAIAGGLAADVVLSDWFLAVTSFGSLFMVAGKRHGELLTHGSSDTRPALAGYTLEHLQFVVSTMRRGDDRHLLPVGVRPPAHELDIPGGACRSSRSWWGSCATALLVDRGPGRRAGGDHAARPGDAADRRGRGSRCSSAPSTSTSGPRAANTTHSGGPRPLAAAWCMRRISERNH